MVQLGRRVGDGPASLAEIRSAVRRFATRLGWDQRAEERLMLLESGFV